MKYEIVIPDIGESVTEGILSGWLKNNGDYIDEGEEMFELETDKASVAVPALQSGIIQITVEAGSEVKVGQIIGSIEEGEPPSEKLAGEPEKTVSIENEKSSIRNNTEKKSEETVTPDSSSNSGSHLFNPDDYPPSVRRLLMEHDLNPAMIEGSGKGGRLTKEDVMSYIEEKLKGNGDKQEKKSPPSVIGNKQINKSGEQKNKAEDTNESQTRVGMPLIRKRIAERLVKAKQEGAHLTTFNEIDMTNTIEMRKNNKEAFEKKHGVRLGFMSIFVSACCKALKDYPSVNALIDGPEIVYNNHYSIGMAVSTERGLVVPVIRNADSLSFAEIEKVITDFGERARTKKLIPDDFIGGTFSITNGGVFGSLMSTPIPNPPQTAILGLHTIQKRPVVIDDEIVVRSMMYVALTYDHRLIDGKEAVSFLRKVKELVEQPEKILLEL